MSELDDLIYDWNRDGRAARADYRAVELDDETLRDGLQGPSVRNPPLEVKLRLLHLMDQLGISSADVGLPGASPQALATVVALAKETTKLKITPNVAVRTHPSDIQGAIRAAVDSGVAIETCAFIGSSSIRRVAESWSVDVMRKQVEELRRKSEQSSQQLQGEVQEMELEAILRAHFPKDEFALARFDGTALYEHADPRQGEHPDWGTLVFNYGRNEVRNFLLASALFWLDQYHVDGLRVDAVASMLYRDYSRREGEWIPNRSGGRENEEAIAFLKEVNERVRDLHPGAVMIAEESTAFPKVTHPAREGGLSFHYKWSLGWMHDTLHYFATDPVHRKWHHNNLTFGLMYIFSENFFLPLSHDEVVHGKGSLLGRMSGDEWQKFANLRALYGWMWAHPGKKLLFMGGEFAQRAEWNHDASLDWHAGVSALVRDLNRALRDEPALYELDGDGRGFQWLQANAVDANVLAFVRWSEDRSRHVVCVANLSPVPRHEYRVGMPQTGGYRELVNSDAPAYGGSGVGNPERIAVEEVPWDGLPQSALLTLPPLGTVWLVPVPEKG